MTQAELIENCANRSWNSRSAFSMINSLMEKGLVRESGFTRCGKSYGRTFEAPITRSQYWEKIIVEQLPPSKIPDFLNALLLKLAPVKPDILQEIQKSIS